MPRADIPLQKAVAGVRVGLLEGRGFVVNPSEEEQAGSSLDLVLAGTADALLMIEGYCDFLSEEQMIEVAAQPCSAWFLLNNPSCVCTHLQSQDVFPKTALV